LRERNNAFGVTLGDGVAANMNGRYLAAYIA
jgi:hypothetical protein